MFCSTCSTASLRAFLLSFALADCRSLQSPTRNSIFIRPGPRPFHASHSLLHSETTNTKPNDCQLSKGSRPKHADDRILPFGIGSISHKLSLANGTERQSPISTSRKWASRVKHAPTTRTAWERVGSHSRNGTEPDITIFDASGPDAQAQDNSPSIEEIKNRFNIARTPSVTPSSQTARFGQAPSKPLEREVKPKVTTTPQKPRVTDREREPWQIQKSALTDKFGSSGWSPRKRLSPDALEGIRALHAQYPEKYTTPELAQRFEVSPEAIRRILKSKWRPNDDEETDRRRRWDKRGVAIWSQMVETGVKPPRKWRQMGVGKNHVPLHKRRGKGAIDYKSEESLAMARPSSHILVARGSEAPLSGRFL